MTEKESKGITLKRGHLIAAAAIVLALMAGGITLGLNWQSWFGGSPETPQTGTPDIDPGAADWNGVKPPDKSESGPAQGIAIPGYPSIGLAAGTKDVRVTLLNPEGNPCYFTFELVLKDTGESLYTSKLVPPGKAVTNITLSRTLEPGDYDATIKITTSSLTDQTAMNGANVETVLIVK